MKHIPCEVCDNAVKGFTDCKLYLEGECRESGCYDAFKPRTQEPPKYDGILPAKRSDQIAWLIFYTITMLLLGAIAYKWTAALF